jgi:hypothetical protein
MSDRANRITKTDLLRKIEGMLRQDISLDVHQIFSKVEDFLVANEKTQPVPGEGVGYVHIDEQRQDEYLEWEKSIKQEWFAIIEDIRESIKRENNPL